MGHTRCEGRAAQPAPHLHARVSLRPRVCPGVCTAHAHTATLSTRTHTACIHTHAHTHTQAAYKECGFRPSYIPLVTKTTLHQVHVLLFVMAATHILICVMVLIVSALKLK
jgi:hypothetical protein